MDMNKIQATNAYQTSSGMSKPADEHGQKLLENKAGVLVSELPGAVYEKSDLITQLQNDAQARCDSLKNMVADAMKTQAGLSVGGDDVWKFLASGNYTVSEAAKKQAEELVSENGYYGVEQTSDRIVQFAKALSGGDVEKADELFKAFQKGYKEATKAWGKELPEISKQTYDAVEKKFNEWKNGTETATEPTV